MDLVCSVCSMKITLDSLKINEYAFIDKNKKNYIIRCPFCGVTHIYLNEKGEIYSVDKYNLNDKTLKILDHAVKLEIFNSDFYKEASILSKDEKVKKMFNDLSKIEYMHAVVHKRLGGFDEMPKVSKLDYTKYNSDNKLIELAMKREEHAVNYYKRYINDVCDDVIKKVFIALSEVEKEHIKLLD